MDTFIYHYLFAVPFLYISISISLNISNLKYKRTRYVYVLFLIFLSFLTINRILNYSNVLNKLSKGSYSEIFHPEYTTLAKLASQKATDSVFIAADWGFGIQIYLFSNGAEKAVYEPFWNYNSIDQLENTISNKIKGKGVNAFITEINGYSTEGKKEYWAFYINGKMAEVGAGSYQLKDGDKIEWKIEKY